MSKDMFKKMKDRITDEVNSATNKLQSMQIIDQLASSIGQQIPLPNQMLPEYNQPSKFTSNSEIRSNKFSLIDDSTAVSGYNEDEELNYDISPQHRLFDEHAITRLTPSSFTTKNQLDNGGAIGGRQNNNLDQSTAVISIDELSSDIEDGLDTSDIETKDDSLDVEIDLLSDKPINNGGLNELNRLSRYKNRYRTVIHAARKINQQFNIEKNQLEAQVAQLTNEVTSLKLELDGVKQNHSSNQHDSLLSVSTTNSENDKSNAGSPQTVTKSSAKFKDLEKLLAKCKESLKLKNSQIQILKKALNEVEKFKEYNQELRQELADLRDAHEAWTVSIAENKRTMHEELEFKNIEMEELKSEKTDLQLKLTDSNGKIKQLKSAIQDLESRLIITSAAHQKERESLTKELTIAKNGAIKQLQLEHEHNMEKVKLNLEKSIEALKAELLGKDEQIMKNAEQLQHYIERSNSLSKELEQCNQLLNNQTKLAQNIQLNYDECLKKCSSAEEKLKELEVLLGDRNEIESKDTELRLKSKELDMKIEELEVLQSDKTELSSRNVELDSKCKDLESRNKELDARIESLEEELASRLANNSEKETLISDSTQFEYLKNIVYQFMLGKQPLVLARVISAVFRFDKDQVDQICKVQETVQATLGQGI